MSNALKRAVRAVFKEARESKSAMKRLLSPPNDNSFAGSRAYPPRDEKKDETFSVHFDRGMTVKGKPDFMMLNLQVNANAKESALRKLAKKYGSHQKYVSVQVNTTQEVNECNLDKLHSEVDNELNELEDL